LAHYLLRYIFRILGTLLIFLGAELFSEGVLKFLPISGEEWESILALIFIAPAFYYFFKKDIKYWWNKFKN
jgi:high-affinity iron transporter